MSYFICTNPNGDHPADISCFFYRYPKPSFFACIKEVNLLSVKSLIMVENNYNLGFLYKTPKDVLKAFFIIVIKQHDKSGPLEMRKALRDAAAWYIGVLQQEFAEEDRKNGGYMLLKDYNRFTPGLQILHVPRMERYILSFEKGVMNFGDDSELFRFCEDVLGYKQEQLAINGEVTVLKM